MQIVHPYSINIVLRQKRSQRTHFMSTKCRICRTDAHKPSRTSDRITGFIYGMSFGMVCHVAIIVTIENGKFSKGLTIFGADSLYRLLIYIATADKNGVDAQIT